MRGAGSERLGFDRVASAGWTPVAGLAMLGKYPARPLG
jgi:hypothetical protein